MNEVLTISRLARRTGVSSKKIRYWESLGLLPRAGRTHTGYRLFDSEAVYYVAFIQKSKAIGLTLSQMAQVLDRARRGANPCREVVEWTREKVNMLDRQIEQLTALRRRLKQACSNWSQNNSCPPGRCGKVCTLIEDLPIAANSKGGKPNEKTMVGGFRGARRTCA